MKSDIEPSENGDD